MKIWKVILATLVIFGAGLVTGGLLVGIADGARERRHHWFQMHDAKFHPPGFGNTNAPTGSNREPGKLSLPFGRPPGKSMGKEFLERLDRELKLEPEQRKRVGKILDESQKHTKEIWEKVAPEMREEMKRSREQMRDVLTPDQNKRLDELMKRGPKPPGEGQTNNAPLPPPENPPAEPKP